MAKSEKKKRVRKILAKKKTPLGLKVYAKKTAEGRVDAYRVSLQKEVVGVWRSPMKDFERRPEEGVSQFWRG